MRTPRVAFLVLIFCACLLLFCRSISSARRSHLIARPSKAQPSSFRTFFSFTAPFSLFPPSAAISLTDDNSTFFPARPAAFGPPLPVRGLSGQLWIGSGFSDETLQDGEGEGELGCSDIPGWEDGRSQLPISLAKQGSTSDKLDPSTSKPKNPRTDDLVKELAKDPVVERDTTKKNSSKRKAESANDGTDDHLHQRLQHSRSPYDEEPTASQPRHADIQSIQETGEITGKIVLLSRGGCGFLEKVRWAQRRGAIALIVGDNQKGGPLIQMFARGNVDNVTIPSVFTSRTTAHLLSSLMQPGSFIEDILDDRGNPLLNVQRSAKTGRTKNVKKEALAAKQVSKTSSPVTSTREKLAPVFQQRNQVRRSWLSRLFRWEGNRPVSPGESRPLSSSRLGLVRPDDFDDNKEQTSTSGLDGADNSAIKSSTGTLSGEPAVMVGENSARKISGNDHVDTGAPAKELAKAEPRPQGFISKILDVERGTKDGERVASSNTQSSSATTSASFTAATGSNLPREGLWVTITPSGSASPFFDTLLVLVISPLITLTVVYALLILRVKIRMRRWRAPKSVVDRLPIRTYHTVAPSPTQSPRAPSPNSSTPTTPLLQGSSRSRPRSRTTTGVPEGGPLLSADDASPRRPRSREKNARNGESQWKKYMGRQVECVVCLEEYVDGVSRVMSLPCGHEFHAECITPWLTTRRRTCPICKNDVVRSLARASLDDPRYEPFREEDYDSNGESSADTYQNRLPSPNRLDDIERGPSNWAQASSSRQEWQPSRNDPWFSAIATRWGGNSSFSPRADGSSGQDHVR